MYPIIREMFDEPVGRPAAHLTNVEFIAKITSNVKDRATRNTKIIGCIQRQRRVDDERTCVVAV